MTSIQKAAQARMKIQNPGSDLSVSEHYGLRNLDKKGKGPKRYLPDKTVVNADGTPAMNGRPDYAFKKPPRPLPPDTSRREHKGIENLDRKKK